MAVDTVRHTIKVALCVCLVCSVMVTGVVTSLQKAQEQNKRLDKIKNILSVAGLIVDGANIEQVYNERIVALLIDLESGQFVQSTDDSTLTPETFQIKEALKSNTYSIRIPFEKDIAHIHRKPKYMPIYLVKQPGSQKQTQQFRVESFILPFYGKGLWSTMYGFLALDANGLEHISGITFYEHGETPGLGGEVDNTKWKEQWKGKRALDKSGNILIEVLKGKVDPEGKNALHQVDGLSGATLTTRGINQMLHFWLGEEGYQKFLRTIKQTLP